MTICDIIAYIQSSREVRQPTSQGNKQVYQIKKITKGFKIMPSTW